MRTIILAVALWASSESYGASIRVDEYGNDTYAVFLHGEELNMMFDTIIVDITPHVGSTFVRLSPPFQLNRDATSAGDEYTFLNPFLGAPSFCFCTGHGFSLLGVIVSETNIEFTGGPLGNTIDTNFLSNAGLFMTNLVLPNGRATANVQLVRAGTIVADLTETFGVPEPTSLTLFGYSVIGYMCSRGFEIRRRIQA